MVMGVEWAQKMPGARVVHHHSPLGLLGGSKSFRCSASL